jgi:hypothetical protein
MPDQNTPLVITRSALKELEQISLTKKVDGIHELDYVQAQQVMIISALINWMASYGLQAPFELNLDE